MKAIVVGSGSGGAVVACELAKKGFEVTILEAGKSFSPLTHMISRLDSLRGSLFLKDETSIEHIFPHYDVTHASEELHIFRGVAEGGCTSISCGNIIRAENGLKEIGLDLSKEFEVIEKSLTITTIPKERWRPLTQKMFEKAEELGFSPKPTPKATTAKKCADCGYCELGCITGAKWDSRLLYSSMLGKDITLLTNHRVKKVIMEGNRAKGVLITHQFTTERINADLIVLSAGGIGTAQILKASGLQARESLWIDIVLTVGGIAKNAQMLKEPPMVWFAKKDHYILSPYFDILSYWFHKPWKNVPVQDRVGMMIKLADAENGIVHEDGTVLKSLTKIDRERLEEGKEDAKKIMEASGVNGPFVDGMIHGGHLGGTVPLTKKDVETMHPDILPENLWVADLSLLPRSQGLPTILTTSALALRVAKHITQESLLNKK